MVSLGRRILETGVDVFMLKIRKVLEDLLPGDLRSQQVEDIFDRDPQPPDTRPSTALLRVEGDPLVHGTTAV